MSRYCKHLFAIVVLVIISVVMSDHALAAKKVPMDSFTSIDRAVNIRPDYSSTVIPPNIAPLNFVVAETGSHYFVKIYSDQGQPVRPRYHPESAVLQVIGFHAQLVRIFTFTNVDFNGNVINIPLEYEFIMKFCTFPIILRNNRNNPISAW